MHSCVSPAYCMQLPQIHGMEAREVLICSNVTKKSYSFCLPITSLLGRQSQQRPSRCHPLVVLPCKWQPHVHPTDVGVCQRLQDEAQLYTDMDWKRYIHRAHQNENKREAGFLPCWLLSL